MNYYTPDIHDLCIGYECEWKNKEGTWFSCILHGGMIEDFQYGEQLDPGNSFIKEVRTPYLSKEQIEAEGWEVIWTTNIETGFTKNGYTLVWSNPYQQNYIKVNDDKDRELFSMYIPLLKDYSINEFRKICKWLGI